MVGTLATQSAHLPESVRDQFAVRPGYLNAASMGVPPRAAAAALSAALIDWQLGTATPPSYDPTIARARQLYADLVRVPPGWVAIGSQVSVFAGMVASSLPDGAEVLTPHGEFTSMTFPFHAQAHRGVTVRAVPLARIADEVRPTTTLVSLSLVQSADGAVADMEAIAAAARRYGAKTFVDTTQSNGWLPYDASTADYTVCGGYKWLCHPRGTAFFTVRPELRDELVPSNAGWFAGGDPWASIYAPELALANDARCFDVSPAWLSWVGAVPALELLTEVGIEAIHRHDLALANDFREGLGLPPGDSAVVSVRHDAAQWRLESAGCRIAARAGAVRVAFHLWNAPDDVDLALRALWTGAPVNT
jgi:selenocysteine lyase/cysteine desulfurase